MTCANHPDRERTAFCQHCGKPLCQECTRPAGNAVFCEPCLAARVSGQPAHRLSLQPQLPAPPAPGDRAPHSPVNSALSPASEPCTTAIRQRLRAPRDLLRLRLIRAHQRALRHTPHGLGHLQAFDAYHTARARRDGTPLPNPFGLNDIGERFGFQNPPEPPSAASAPQPPPPNPTPNQGSASNMPPYNYRYDYNYSYQYPPCLADPGDAGNPFEDIKPHHGFPTAAIWLIALGVLFLLGNLSILPHFYARQF